MPDWQTIKTVGSIFIEDHLEDGPGIRNSRQFLHETVEAFTKQSVSYYGVVGEFPFVYKERQLHSVLFPSIAKVADAAFMEQPVSRKDKDTIGYGWLDYWIMYGTSVFLIELKHAWNAIKTDTVRNSALQSWNEAQNQLKEIGRDDVRNLSLTLKVS